jgi:hypothetical protein
VEDDEAAVATEIRLAERLLQPLVVRDVRLGMVLGHVGGGGRVELVQLARPALGLAQWDEAKPVSRELGDQRVEPRRVDRPGIERRRHLLARPDVAPTLGEARAVAVDDDRTELAGALVEDVPLPGLGQRGAVAAAALRRADEHPHVGRVLRLRRPRELGLDPADQ